MENSSNKQNMFTFIYILYMYIVGKYQYCDKLTNPNTIFHQKYTFWTPINVCVANN